MGIPIGEEREARREQVSERQWETWEIGVLEVSWDGRGQTLSDIAGIRNR